VEPGSVPGWRKGRISAPSEESAPPTVTVSDCEARASVTQRRQAFSLESDGEVPSLNAGAAIVRVLESHGYFFEVKAAGRVGFR
jgi:hypothetical protein